jgi:endonuclease-8
MEGPSLVILREDLQPFLGQKVLRVSGNTKQPKEQLKGLHLAKIDTWAKVLFLTFSSSDKKTKIVTKTHFLMFGSYRIDEPKENRFPRLELKFKNGVVYFYSCSILFFADEYLAAVDREVDVMSSHWNEKHVLERMKEKKDSYLCDLFLDQTVFAGSGNIVKNEVLFNLRQHPLTKLSQISKHEWTKVAHAVRDYCFHFYEWKKHYELRRHWQVYRKHLCPICQSKLKKENLGRGKRKTFFCTHEQKRKKEIRRLKIYEVLPVQGQPQRERELNH